MRYTFALAGLTVAGVVAIALLSGSRVVESVPAPTSRMLEAAERQQRAGVHVEDYTFTAEELRPDPPMPPKSPATRPTTSAAVHQ